MCKLFCVLFGDGMYCLSIVIINFHYISAFSQTGQMAVIILLCFVCCSSQEWYVLSTETVRQQTLWYGSN